jgi:lipopolysaccharide export system ATP-binding protein
MNNKLLSVKNLSKTYSLKKVVNNLSFHINKGEVLGLLGPNGAGKTTAFYMTIGLVQADSGKVFFKEKDITNLPIHKRALMGMGYLAQEPSIFTDLTVEDNILCILETQNLSKNQKETKLKSLLEELHLLPLKKHKAITLSGGERRRLEITRALANEPSLLLLDEPFANIDPISVEEVKHLIKILKSKNISILITDHNAREIFSIADRSYVMQDGKVLISGTVEELINNAEAKKYYLGESFRL